MVLMESKQRMSTGAEAPYFILRGVDDRDHALKEFSGKPTLIIFMCNHCPYVKAKVQAMVSIKNTFGDRINVVGINSNDPRYEGEGFENMKKFAVEHRLNFPYLIDDSQKIAREYGAVCTPDPFLFDSEGKLVYHGRLDSSPSIDTATKGDVVERNISNLLDGKEIENEFMPAQGCSIKWKRV